MTWKLSIFVMALLVIVSGIGGYKFAPTKIQYVETIVTKIDTVYQTDVETIYKWLPAEKEIVNHVITETETILDTVWMQQPVDRAYFSDSLKTDDAYYGFLNVAYYYPPWDKFNYKFEPAPFPVITKSVIEYRTQQKSWYQSGWLKVGLGLGAGLILSRSN